MRLFEVALVLRASITGTAREKLLDTIKKWLGDVKVAKVDDWGKKALVYPLKKEREGNYLILEVEADKGLPADFEKRLLMEDGILRHLVIRRN